MNLVPFLSWAGRASGWAKEINGASGHLTHPPSKVWERTVKIAFYMAPRYSNCSGLVYLVNFWNALSIFVFFLHLLFFHIGGRYLSIPVKRRGTYGRCTVHLEAGPIPLEVDCMKFQRFLGWRPASTTHFSKIITGVNFSICKGLRVNKLGRFNKSRIIQ